MHYNHIDITTISPPKIALPCHHCNHHRPPRICIHPYNYNLHPHSTFILIIDNGFQAVPPLTHPTFIHLTDQQYHFNLLGMIITNFRCFLVDHWPWSMALLDPFDRSTLSIFFAVIIIDFGYFLVKRPIDPSSSDLSPPVQFNKSEVTGSWELQAGIHNTTTFQNCAIIWILRMWRD